MTTLEVPARPPPTSLPLTLSTDKTGGNHTTTTNLESRGITFGKGIRIRPQNGSPPVSNDYAGSLSPHLAGKFGKEFTPASQQISRLHTPTLTPPTEYSYESGTGGPHSATSETWGDYMKYADDYIDEPLDLQSEPGRALPSVSDFATPTPSPRAFRQGARHRVSPIPRARSRSPLDDSESSMGADKNRNLYPSTFPELSPFNWDGPLQTNTDDVNLEGGSSSWMDRLPRLRDTSTGGGQTEKSELWITKPTKKPSSKVYRTNTGGHVYRQRGPMLVKEDVDGENADDPVTSEFSRFNSARNHQTDLPPVVSEDSDFSYITSADFDTARPPPDDFLDCPKATFFISSTISKDNTQGDQVRIAKLLANLAQKHRKGPFRGGFRKNDYSMRRNGSDSSVSNQRKVAPQAWSNLNGKPAPKRAESDFGSESDDSLVDDCSSETSISTANATELLSKESISHSAAPQSRGAPRARTTRPISRSEYDDIRKHVYDAHTRGPSHSQYADIMYEDQGNQAVAQQRQTLQARAQPQQQQITQHQRQLRPARQDFLGYQQQVIEAQNTATIVSDSLGSGSLANLSKPHDVFWSWAGNFSTTYDVPGNAEFINQLEAEHTTTKSQFFESGLSGNLSSGSKPPGEDVEDTSAKIRPGSRRFVDDDEPESLLNADYPAQSGIPSLQESLRAMLRPAPGTPRNESVLDAGITKASLDHGNKRSAISRQQFVTFVKEYGNGPGWQHAS